MDALNIIIQNRTAELEANLEQCRQTMNELVTSLASAKATIAQMEQARRDRDDRWAYLLGEKCTEATIATKERDNALAQLEILRNPNTKPQQPDIQP